MRTTGQIENPFTPSFGEVPPYMAGRGDVLTSLLRAFERSGRSPYLTCAISGARGTGKTALLALAGREAQARGWVCADATALPGLLEDVYERAIDAAAQLADVRKAARLSSVSLGGLGASWEYPQVEGRNWRSRMSALLDGLAETGTGLLITVDEVRPDVEELVQLVATYQHFVREGRKVALLMAGLPRNMSRLIGDRSVSFLRRAQRVVLGNVREFEAQLALERSFAMAGKGIDPTALRIASDATKGFPYMIQLVGYHVWETGEDQPTIGMVTARRGVEVALLELEDRILAPTYYDLSEGDRAFLHAMLEDEGASELHDIALRMGKSNSYAAQYKRRLLEQGVIEEGYAKELDFAIPGLREFVGRVAG